MIRIFFLPNLSESLPKIGEETSWKKEYVAPKSPISKGLPPNFSAINGRRGKIIPKPKRSIRTIKNIVPSALFFIVLNPKL